MARRPRARTLQHLENIEHRARRRASSLSAAGILSTIDAASTIDNYTTSTLTNAQRSNLGRDVTTIAAGLDDYVGEFVRSRVRSTFPFVRSKRLRHFEDNRSWSPGLRFPKGIRKRAVPIRIATRNAPAIRNRSSSKGRSLLTYGVEVKAPAFALLCIRRKRRRAAIFAFGKSGGRHRRPRRNRNSSLWC